MLAVTECLEQSGKLSKFKAALRIAVMSVLNKNSPPNKPRPEIPAQTKLLNDLIREYLIWNGFLYTDQVFLAESGQSSEKPVREYLSAVLDITDDTDTQQIPLLYRIYSAFRKQLEESSCEDVQKM